MSDYTDVLFNTQMLISFKSITPDDGGSHAWLANAFTELGFKVEELNHGKVKNLLIKPIEGFQESTVLFVGHTDVVPADEQDWDYPPFSGKISDTILYGRGAVDMKSSIAAILSVIALKCQQGKKPNIGLLLTSNEEGESDFGIEYVLKHHKNKLDNIKKVLIGEPTSSCSIGDTIKVGRRGSLNLLMTVSGKPGHVAYPEKCYNPIEVSLKLIQKLQDINWSKKFPNFDQSNMTIVDLASNNNVFNTTPKQVEIKINWRFNPNFSVEKIKTIVNDLINIQFATSKICCHWKNQAEPFYNHSLDFAKSIGIAIESVTKIKPKLSTSGGTSDARFFDPSKFELVELGPCNQFAHKTNEQIPIKDLITLASIYDQVLEREATLCSSQDPVA